MNKRHIIVASIAVILIGGAILAFRPWATNNNQNNSIKEVTFYYLPTCPGCQKVEQEGTLDKIEALGIKVNKINASIGPIKHKFESVPTLAIDNQVYSGYKTFEQLKELLGFSGNSVDAQNINLPTGETAQADFIGAKGETKEIKDGQVEFQASEVGGQARFYNVKMPGGKTVYFFIVKDRNGIYRAAANACQVCFGQRKGFRQENDEIVCNNCGNRYPIEKIATEKGGCNPGPINANLQVSQGRFVITEAELSQVADLF